MRPNGWLSCNEWFAATNQREGSEIARLFVSAQRVRCVRMAFVTYLTEVARDLRQPFDPGTLYEALDRRSV